MMIMTYILDWPFETSYSDLNGAIFRGEPLFLKRTKQQLNNSQAVIKENVLIRLRLGCVECLEWFEVFVS